MSKEAHGTGMNVAIHVPKVDRFDGGDISLNGSAQKYYDKTQVLINAPIKAAFMMDEGIMPQIVREDDGEVSTMGRGGAVPNDNVPEGRQKISDANLVVYGKAEVIDGPITVTKVEHPADPEEGMFYFNTTDKAFYGYDGTQWVNLAAGGGGGPITRIEGEEYETILDQTP